jgi:hypothetical protein
MMHRWCSGSTRLTTFEVAGGTRQIRRISPIGVGYLNGLQPCPAKKSGGSLPWNYDEMILLIHGCGWHSAWWCFLISVLGKGIVF